MKQTVLKVSGMKCDGCAKTIEEAVKACAGVSSAKAQFKEGMVEIVYEEGVASLESIKKAIADKGFVPA
jgi:copper chaperone CopZ